MEASKGRLGSVLGRLGDVPGASWAVLGRPGSLLGRLRVAMDGSGFVVYLKGLESSKLLFFFRNFNGFVVRGSNLVGRTSSSMGRDSIYVGRKSSSGGS